MDDFIKEDLPEASASSVLERISKNKLMQLFPESEFIIRWELDTDAGVDGSIEVLFEGKHTNMRGHFQLKAVSRRQKNQDDSISFSVKTKNLNYMKTDPAGLYFLYVEDIDSMFFLWVSDILVNLESNNPQWNRQSNNTVRFRNRLSSDSLQKLNEIIVRATQLTQQLHEAMRRSVSPEVTISVNTKDFTISDSKDIELFIAKHGLTAINSGFAFEIMQLSNSLSISQHSIPRIQITLAYANSILGEKYSARSLVQKLRSNSDLESEDDRMFLEKLDVSIALSFGETTFETYLDHLKQYLDPDKDEYYEYRLEQLCNTIHKETNTEKIHQLIDVLSEVIKRIEQSDYFTQGFKLNAQYKYLECVVDYVSLNQIQREFKFSASVSLRERGGGIDISGLGKDLISDYESLLSKVGNLRNEAVKLNNKLLEADLGLLVYRASLWGIMHCFISLNLRGSRYDKSELQESSMQLGIHLEEQLNTYIAKNSLKGQLDTLALQAEAFELSGNRKLEIEAASKLLKLASLCYDESVKRKAKAHIDGIGTKLASLQEDIFLATSEDSDVGWSSDSDKELRDFSLEMMRALELPSECFENIYQDALANQESAKQRIAFCQHLVLLQDLNHLNNKSFMYRSPVKWTCSCDTKNIVASFESIEWNKVIQNFKSTFCVSCKVKHVKS